MGTQNQRHGKIRNLKAIEEARFALQETIDNSKDIEERRKLGQFSTPIDLAKEIASYGLTLLPTKEISFLEPCWQRCVLLCPVECSTKQHYSKCNGH